LNVSSLPLSGLFVGPMVKAWARRYNILFVLSVRHEMKFLVDNGYLRWIPYALLYDLSKFMGLSMGKRERFLAPALKRRLSTHAYHWTTTEHREA